MASKITTSKPQWRLQQRNQQKNQLNGLQHLHRAIEGSYSSWISNSFNFTIVLYVVLSLLIANHCSNAQIDGYIAGEDYPAYDSIPSGLSFNCRGRQPGYYADTETQCQVWHWCLHSGHQYSFLCPNGTVFNQAVRVCDWWSNVNCASSEQLYKNNDELYLVPDRRQLKEEQLVQNDI